MINFSTYTAYSAVYYVSAIICCWFFQCTGWFWLYPFVFMKLHSQLFWYWGNLLCCWFRSFYCYNRFKWCIFCHCSNFLLMLSHLEKLVLVVADKIWCGYFFCVHQCLWYLCFKYCRCCFFCPHQYFWCHQNNWWHHCWLWIL